MKKILVLLGFCLMMSFSVMSWSDEANADSQTDTAEEQETAGEEVEEATTEEENEDPDCD